MASPSPSRLGAKIIGTGSAVPARVLTNAELSEQVDTSDEWIVSRTGIKARHIIQGETLVDLATGAAQKAIGSAGISAQDLDLIILATSSPDDLFGSAARVQKLLGAKRAVAFDLSAACSGFVFGLVTATQFLRADTYQNILLIGADVLSRWLDWSDRRTCILFGDGAGAVVLTKATPDRVLGYELHTDGEGNDLLNLNLELDQPSFLSMNGKEVYRFAVTAVPEVIEQALSKAGLTIEAIDWLILHQANQRILDAVAERLHIPSHKVISNLAAYGNTSAASIPLALDQAIANQQIQPGDRIMIAGFGAGLSWGAAIFYWQ
ncbi:MAG: beta-ketoacyl-ACP synthase III [Pseudanabaenaceae cyanobacterium bins.68]|nr:beta-ketoacyl-ACP synthase III [Pseudanabaenaceae cyanobacterium bins.68]